MKKNSTHWPKGVFRHLEYPEIPVFELLRSSARKWPDRKAIIFRDTEITYRELDELSDRFAGALASLGVSKGDRVGMHLPNSPQFAIAYLGLLKAGAVYVPVSPLLSETELSFQLADAEVETYVGLDEFFRGKRGAISDSPVKRIILTGIADRWPPSAPPERTRPEGAWDFTALVAEHDPSPPETACNPREDLAHIAYTGGTTGTPKGAMITHFNVVVNCCQYYSWFSGGGVAYRDGIIETVQETGAREDDEHPLIPGEETALVVSPWFHALGVVGYLNRTTILGCTMVVFQRFDPGEFLQAVRKFRPTFFGGAPQLFVALVDHPLYQDTDMSFVKVVVSGAAPLSVSLMRTLQEKLPGAIYEGYGLTEVTMGATSNPPRRDRWRLGSVGLPVPDTEVKIVDPENGARELPTGESGEICIRGPQVMKGYWKRPEETAAVLNNGWLFTGDIGKFDQDGYLYILDRKKDMLIYKGYNVYPRDLEEVLNSHPGVSQSAVVGKKDERVGELPVAFIQLGSGQEVTEEELLTYANQRLAAYKKIRALKIIGTLPASPAGKILKRKLRDSAQEIEIEPSFAS